MATTNFILVNMDSKGLSFESALAEAERAGVYAEADPSADIDGFDAARGVHFFPSLRLFTPRLRFERCLP